LIDLVRPRPISAWCLQELRKANQLSYAVNPVNLQSYSRKWETYIRLFKLLDNYSEMNELMDG